MSEQPDIFPHDGWQAPSAGQSPFGRAPQLVKVAGILNIVMAGIDIIYALFLFLGGVAILAGLVHDLPAGTPENPLPPKAIGTVVLVLAPLALIAGIVQLVGGIRLLRLRRGTWAWGLTAGIIGCTQLWCSYLCFLPIGIGIFTIVTMCRPNVRRYLHEKEHPGRPEGTPA